jgi:hypothetical protein
MFRALRKKGGPGLWGADPGLGLRMLGRKLVDKFCWSDSRAQ